MAGLPSVGRLSLGSQGFEVSAQGLGCMGMSAFYGPPKPEEEIISLIRHAGSRGIREKVQLATKFGAGLVDGIFKIRGDPAYVRACCEASLKRLEVDCIDLYYQHRIDTKVPIEVTIGELKKLVEEGKIKELGIGIVPYSPLGRGFFTSGGKSVENLTNDDFRKAMPRLTEENLEKNNVTFAKIAEIASSKGCSPGQLSLASIFHQGNDISPIPGTTKVKNLEENIGALSVKITSNEMKEIENILSNYGFSGNRVADDNKDFTWMNSETPPFSSWKDAVS
eukprot:PITA_18793